MNDQFLILDGGVLSSLPFQAVSITAGREVEPTGNIAGNTISFFFFIPGDKPVKALGISS